MRSAVCVGEVGIMEIPMPLPPLASFVPVMEDEADDIPPSPTPEFANSGLFFQRGFWDCAQEALRFLTEEEGMPEDSPVVSSLKRHLLNSTHSCPPWSLAAPLSTQTAFTYPSRPVAGALKVCSKQSYPSGLGDSRHCPSASHLDSVRFSPYSVPSHRSTSNGSMRYSSQESDKLNSLVTSQRNSLLQAGSVHRPPFTCPTTKSLDSVLRNSVISTDDLHGVLKCLQSSQTIPVLNNDSHQHNTHYSLSATDSSVHSCSSVLPSFSHLAASRSSPSSHLLSHALSTSSQSSAFYPNSSMVPSSNFSPSSSLSASEAQPSIDRPSTLTSANQTVSEVSCHEKFLNDSGIDDVGSGELNDEVDSFNYSGGAEDNVFDVNTLKCLESSGCILNGSETDLGGGSHNTVREGVSSDVDSVHLVSADSSSVREQTSTDPALDSSPSSQLSLLTSLSSGTHRITSVSGEGNATASRIQSLASQILLLLQEEAEAGDESSDEDDDEEEDDSESEEEDELDGEDFLVEVEP